MLHVTFYKKTAAPFVTKGAAANMDYQNRLQAVRSLFTLHFSLFTFH